MHRSEVNLASNAIGTGLVLNPYDLMTRKSALRELAAILFTPLAITQLAGRPGGGGVGGPVSTPPRRGAAHVRDGGGLRARPGGRAWIVVAAVERLIAARPEHLVSFAHRSAGGLHAGEMGHDGIHRVDLYSHVVHGALGGDPAGRGRQIDGGPVRQELHVAGLDLDRVAA